METRDEHRGNSSLVRSEDLGPHSVVGLQVPIAVGRLDVVHMTRRPPQSVSLDNTRQTGIFLGLES